MKKVLSILAIGTGIGALVLLAGTASVQAKPGFGKCDSCHTAKPPKKVNVKSPASATAPSPTRRPPARRPASSLVRVALLGSLLQAALPGRPIEYVSRPSRLT